MKPSKLFKPLTRVEFARILTLIVLMLAMRAGPALAQQKKTLKTSNDGTTALSITPNGNVGIGTPTPQAKLDVQGKIKLTGDSINLNTNNTNGSINFNGAINLNGNVKLNTSNLLLKLSTDSAFISWGARQKGTISDSKIAIGGRHGVNIGIVDSNKNFFEALRVGDFYQSAMVDIRGQARTGDMPTGLTMLVTGDLNTVGKGIEFKNSDGLEGIGFTKNTIYGTNKGETLNFKVSGLGNMTFSAPKERMFINSNGTVGIMEELFVGSDPSPTFIASHKGFVGIGVKDPQAPLSVYKKMGNTFYNQTYTKDNRKAFDIRLEHNGNKYNAGGQFSDCSIYAIGDIVTATAFVGAQNNSYSDIRLKKDFRASSPVQDLETLRKVQITDYKMIDTIENNRSYKKVIAQQVQKVYPMAVSTSFRTLPDVFQHAVSVTKQADSLYTITLAKSAKLKAGEQLELKCPEAGDVKVNVVTLFGDKSFTVNAATDLTKQADVFVYGHPATDVLTVDYDAISMLNVSATQQLANIVDEQQKQIDNQQKQIDKLSKQNADLMQAVQGMTLAMERFQKTNDSKTQTIAEVNASAGK
ncbi:tail fiber domain-containing protein [Mucilaginibacter sp.]|uniref:tail fiber domain-containing protein n=1 Tax=Mucilaginibacter sp. TaxID=1882438 RepID=UPI0032646FF0